MDTRAKPLAQFLRERSISKPTGYRLIAAGKLKAHKIASRTFVLTEHERAFDESLVALPTRQSAPKVAA